MINVSLKTCLLYPCSTPALNINRDISSTKKKVVGFVDEVSPERYPIVKN